MVTAQDMFFSWVIPQSLAGCRGPWRAAEVRFLREQGILTLVRLQEHAKLRIDSKAVEALGIEEYHYPIPDGGAPTPEAAHHLVEFIEQRITKGKPVAVTCGAGIGRTGTILACYLVAQGMSAEEAIPALRGIRSPSIETQAQYAAIYAYEELLASSSCVVRDLSSRADGSESND